MESMSISIAICISYFAILSFTFVHSAVPGYSEIMKSFLTSMAIGVFAPCYFHHFPFSFISKCIYSKKYVSCLKSHLSILRFISLQIGHNTGKEVGLPQPLHSIILATIHSLFSRAGTQTWKRNRGIYHISMFSSWEHPHANPCLVGLEGLEPP